MKLMRLIKEEKLPGVLRRELAWQLGISTVTAWTMRRKIAHAMRRREGEPMLVGLVEDDESCVGGPVAASLAAATSGRLLHGGT
jgi:hypothetical protein